MFAATACLPQWYTHLKVNEEFDVPVLPDIPMDTSTTGPRTPQYDLPTPCIFSWWEHFAHSLGWGLTDLPFFYAMVWLRPFLMVSGSWVLSTKSSCWPSYGFRMWQVLAELASVCPWKSAVCLPGHTHAQLPSTTTWCSPVSFGTDIFW